MNLKVSEAEKNFAKLVDQVYTQGISVDLERDEKVIARLTPVPASSRLSVGQLNTFVQNLPSLGSDADDFARDIDSIRAKFPAEANPWE